MKFKARCFPVKKIQESLSGEIGSWPVLGLTLRERQERALLWANGGWAKEGETANLCKERHLRRRGPSLTNRSFGAQGQCYDKE